MKDLRALSTLHVSNVANVAYGFAKILNASQRASSVACHDITHLMSQPEWDDLPLNPEDFPDQWNFFENTADFGSYRRPSWFASDPVHDPYLDLSPVHARVRRWFGRRLPAPLKHRIEPLYEAARRWQFALMRRNVAPAQEGDGAAHRFSEVIETVNRLGPRWEVHAASLERYLPHRDWLARHAESHDVIATYVLSPIYGMLYGRKPQISVEIGTMRDIAFDTSVTSKLLWPAYRLSDHVILTNPDNRAAAENAGITSYSFCPHPVDERFFHPGEEVELRRTLLERYGVEHVLIAPARQNWEIKGNDKLLRAFARLRTANINAVLLVPAWGQEIDRSRGLARDLGVERFVAWLAPMPEPLLAQHYRAADIVFDQFQLGVFGLITPKAMACGAAVVTSYEPSHHAWCFAEDPPLVRSATEDEIVHASLALLDHERRLSIGAAARKWFEAHHSAPVVVKAWDHAIGAAVDRFASRT